MSGSAEYFDFLNKLESDPSFCYNYIKDNGLNKSHPTYEKCLETISKNAKHSRAIAENLIKGRFKLGEEAISKDSLESYWYAKEVIKGRWEMGEQAISCDPRLSFDYASRVLRGRFELGELTIAKNENLAYLYAREVIKGKLPEEMHNIMLAKRIAA